MSYHRRPKVEGTWEAVRSLQARLEEAQEERELKEASVDQARKVADRWSSTHHRRLGELAAIDRKIESLTEALDTLAPEVDEYGIERRLREGSPA